MAVDPQPTGRPPRLNPFLFPSDTDFRFVLLIVSVLGSSLFTFNLLYFNVVGEDHKQAILDCVAANPLDETLDTDGKVARANAIAQCLDPFERRQAVVLGAGVVLVAVAATAIYQLTPALKIRREQLRRLSARDAPEVVAFLADLHHEAGLRRSPQYVWNPLNPTISGLAFGRWGRYYVALTGGLVTQFYTDRPAFRAVVLHELAHLRNADIDKTYFAVAVWQAYVALVLIPLGVITLYYLPGDPLQAFNIAWRMLALALLVYLIRNAILRAREHYADVRASMWDGPSDALSRVIMTLPRPGKLHWLARLGAHPHPASRLRTLTETQHLFRLNFWDAFGTGLVTTIALSELYNAIALLLPTTQNLWSPFVTALLFAPLVVGVVGPSAWRVVFAALARGQAPGGLGRAGLALGLGFVAGQLLAFRSGLTDITPAADWIESAASFAFTVVWSLVLLASLFLFMRWIAAGASAWLEVVPTLEALRRIIVPGFVITTGTLTLGLTALFGVREIFRDLPTILLTVVLDVGLLIAAFIAVGNSWWVFVGAVSLWIFPLAAWLWRAHSAPVSSRSWGYLDPPGQVAASHSQLRPGLALALGLIGGLLFCGLLAAARVILLLVIPEAVRDTDDYRLAFNFGQIGVAAVLQVIPAVVASAWAKRLGALHGLLAAFVGGCVMAAGILSLSLLINRRFDLEFIRLTFLLVVNGGALLALPTGLIVESFAAQVRRIPWQDIVGMKGRRLVELRSATTYSTQPMAQKR